MRIEEVSSLENFQTIMIHFSEIALKGRNRGEFENALISNIGQALGKELKTISRTEGRISVTVNEVTPWISERLKKVFGISWFSHGRMADKEINAIVDCVLENCEGYKGKKIKVETTRADKRFPMTSPEINREVGKRLELAGHLIDIKKPEKKIFIEILKDAAVILFDRAEGPGGLPVGTAGPVLVLLSGGIDSPAAAWLMMKRGCNVDFLHIHSGPVKESVLESKIPRIMEKLMEYNPGRSRLFIAPYTEFYKKSMNIDQRIELVVFRKFMLRLADRIAKEYGHLGIVTGDNIGQVASQTVENLYAINDATRIPIYRPLATYDKQEIVDLSKRIGTYELSIQEYKDCCSLVAVKHPSTKAKPERAREAEEKIGMEGIIEKTMAQVDVIELRSGPSQA